MAATVSSTMWSIDCLLDRLPAGPQYRGLRLDLEDINRHLRRCRPLRGAAVTAPARLWTRLLREIAYDVEDWLDGRRRWRRLLGLVLCPWRQRARIQGFRDRFQRLHDLGTGLDLVGGGAAASDLLPPVPTSDNDDDDDVPAGCGEGKLPPPPRGQLVGLDGPESELVEHLVVDGEERGWKVVCILGPGGVGKTSLARELLRKLQGHFDCVAFVYVGWNPSAAAVQMDVARQVMPAESLLPCDEKTITRRLREFLSTRRYLIVVDDVWKTRSWTSITCAFPWNGLGSRIVATTEFEHMARFCCVRRTDLVYLLKPLSYCDSKSLMLSRMCAPKEDCVLDSNNLHDVLRICGGNPLALVVMAGLVAAKRSGSFELSSMAAPTSSIWSVTHEMGKMLDMSYVDLPLRVKPCFLYLSMFPENHTIMKDRLIRRWIAEGFIPTRNGESLWNTGESYFSELARRGLIQLVLDDSDEQIGCTVHSVIHEFILSLAAEENFATIGDRLSYDSYPGNTVRRFALDCSNKIESGILASYTRHLSRVRSLAVSGNTNQQLSDVSAFKLVRVLDLEGATGLGKHQLRSIGSLIFLRYLGLRGSDVSMLPEKMKALEHLATIDVRQTKVKHLPEFSMGNLVSFTTTKTGFGPKV